MRKNRIVSIDKCDAEKERNSSVHLFKLLVLVLFTNCDKRI